MHHTQWVNKLFETFIKDGNISIYFEEKERLESEETIINLSIHPIRFADDIFFNFETNNQNLRHKLKHYEVNYNIFYHYADSIKATCIKNTKTNSIKENSLLLIGQTQNDRVVFDGQKYLSIIDFLDELKLLGTNYEHIYFKPHPYSKNNKYIFRILKKELKNINITHENIYYLLSNDNIRHVTGLNSSVLYEAKYFKKDVTFLYKKYFDFINNDIGIYGDYFNSSFWSYILEIEDAQLSIPFQQNRLRKYINDFWGYNEISDEIVIKDIIKNKIKYYLSKYIR